MSGAKKMWLAIAACAALAVTWADRSSSQDAVGPLRIGYTDHVLLISAMPDFQEAQRQIGEQGAADEATLRGLYDEFQIGVRGFEAQEPLLAAEAKEKKQNELRAKQAEIEAKAQEFDAKLAAKQNELLAPIYQRVDQAIKDVAKANGIDLVMRSQVGSEPFLLYADESRVLDITREVADKLGIPNDEG